MSSYKYKYRITGSVIQTERPTVELIVLGLQLLPLLYDAVSRTLHTSDNIPVTIGRAVSCAKKHRSIPYHLLPMMHDPYPLTKIEELPIQGTVFMLDTFLRAMRAGHPKLHVIDARRVLVMTPVIWAESRGYVTVSGVKPAFLFDEGRLAYLLRYLENVAERLE